MRTRRSEPRQAFVLALLAATAALVLVAAGGHGANRPTASSLVSWEGLAGGARPPVALGQRMIVVLTAPSVADRVARAGGRATGLQERRWNSAALAAQNVLISRLALQGVRVQTEFRFTRVLNGFSAPLDARVLALLERAPQVAGVYPVRRAYPAAVSSQTLRSSGLTTGLGVRRELTLPGFDGRGVTIAVLDTGVDRAQPFLRGRVVNGVDIVGGQTYALAAPKPDNPAELERHGTEMAGLIVGAGGPAGLVGLATGASILPVRVAGWQRDATGSWSVFGRTDQLLAGLESAVDPNGDGDAHDAARIALVGLASPFAAFADDPVARGVTGALRLDTLVVAPAGNDGPAGPGFGSISGPGGAPDALTVGAVDLRHEIEQVRVVVRAGLKIELDTVVPLGGAVAPASPLTLTVAVPRQPEPRRPAGSLTLDRFFDETGLSLVAGRAALVPASTTPAVAVANAARAGAGAVLVHGSLLPGGALGLDESVTVPAVGIPEATAAAIALALARGTTVAVSIGKAHVAPNAAYGRVAPFSSVGLAFDGRVKPDLVAPGVGLATAEPGQGEDASPRFGSVNGTSAAAALTAAAAALLAQARPGLDAAALRGLLVASARPIAGEPVVAQGAGLLDVGAAAAGEVAVGPTTLSLGQVRSLGWHRTGVLTVRNVSPRPVRLRVGIEHVAEGAASVRFAVRPRRLLLPRGGRADIRVTARAASAARGNAAAEGFVVLRPAGGSALQVPWTITFGPPRPRLLGRLALTTAAFSPSDDAPAVLTFQAGRITRLAGRDQVQPLERLDIELRDSEGDRLGLLARVRDVLPGLYRFGLTGRGPGGQVLGRGSYRLVVVAVPPGGGPATWRSARFRIK